MEHKICHIAFNGASLRPPDPKLAYAARLMSCVFHGFIPAEHLDLHRNIFETPQPIPPLKLVRSSYFIAPLTFPNTRRFVADKLIGALLEKYPNVVLVPVDLIHDLDIASHETFKIPPRVLLADGDELYLLYFPKRSNFEGSRVEPIEVLVPNVVHVLRFVYKIDEKYMDDIRYNPDDHAGLAKRWLFHDMFCDRPIQQRGSTLWLRADVAEEIIPLIGQKWYDVTWYKIPKQRRLPV